MPRTPTVRYFASRGAYYTQYHGKQHLLAAGPKDEPDGPTFREATVRYARLMHVGEMDKAEDNCAVSAVIARYYHSLEREGKKGTLHLARAMLDPAIAEFGHVKVKELKPIIVDDWIAKQTGWNSTTKNTAVSNLSRAMSWATEQQVITKNPVAGMKKHEKLVRGKEMVLPEGLQDLLIEVANRGLRKLLRMLRGTGARPGEIMHADAKHYRASMGIIVFPWNPAPGEYRWKAGKKTKRDRVIYLTPELRSLVECEIKANGGAGRIFRTLQGKPWSGGNLTKCMGTAAARKRVKAWCNDHGFDAAKIMPYSFRHSYITRMLTAGCPIKIVADLCGTSVKMIEATYSHGHEDLLAMQRLFIQFSQPSAGPSSEQPRP